MQSRFIVTLGLFVGSLLFGCNDEDAGRSTPEDSLDEVAQSSLSVAARTSAPKPTIVLVHGAWADALGWQRVIGILDAKGFRVTAVENPLTSLADDVATTKRILDAETAKGPVVLVAHSYGGAAITGAAVDNANVKALVYINAFAPDVDEPVGHLAGLNPGPLGTALVQDATGYLTIDRSQFANVFCGDIPARRAAILAVTQKPVFGGVFTETLEKAAWRTIPSFYLIGTKDNAILPATQRFMAARMHAKTVEVAASHASFISHPDAVVELIEEAAK